MYFEIQHAFNLLSASPTSALLRILGAIWLSIHSIYPANAQLEAIHWTFHSMSVWIKHVGLGHQPY